MKWYPSIIQVQKADEPKALTMSVESLDGSQKSWALEVSTIVGSTDDMRGNPVDYLRKQYFCIVWKFRRSVSKLLTQIWMVGFAYKYK